MTVAHSVTQTLAACAVLLAVIAAGATALHHLADSPGGALAFLPQ